ncbi:MAG: Stk1 family PASTA domain-containing Ser/Thr kinase [Bacillota bacterium]
MKKKILGNRYKIIEKIGEGGMAKVYKAKDKVLNRHVAIKVLKENLKSDEEFVKKFDREAMSAASLSHSNIVNVYDVGEDGNIKYIVMEYIKGITLKKIIDSNKDFLANDDILDVAFQISSAIKHAHENGIIHRDIKPENIIITSEKQIKVTDFGIARAATSSTRVNNKKALGSVHFTSPEQARGGVIDQRTDIYSLGVLLYQLSTNKLPFNGDTEVEVALKHLEEKMKNPREINPDLSKGLEKIIVKSTKKNPNNRYNNLDEILSDLKKVSNGLDDNIVVNDINTDGETKRLPDIGELKNMSSKRKNNKNNKNNNKFAMIIAVIAALVFTVGIFSVFFVDDFLDSFKNNIVKVPEVVGMSKDQGVSTLKDKNLNIEIVDSKYSNKYSKGTIVEQSVEPGEEVKEEFIIELSISKGTEKVEVPNVLNKKFLNGKITLENSDLVIGSIDYEYSQLPRDTIIDTNPNPDSQVAIGSKINLIVSNGPELKKVIVPSLVGLTLNEAKERLGKINLSLKNISYESNEDIPKDEIIKQTPKSGKEVDEGSTIDIVIDNDVIVKEDTVDEESSSEDNKLVKKAFFIPLNFENDKGILKVTKQKDSNEEIKVYEKEHHNSEGNVRVVVEASGENTIRIYFDDKVISTQVKDFK